MMSVSQVDMVALVKGGGLQVCGNLSPMKDEAAPSPTDLQSITVAVRQGDSIATLHAATPFRLYTPDEFEQGLGPGEPDRFVIDPNGLWQLKGLGTGDSFTMGQSAVVSAVLILKRERAGLETHSWVQPARIVDAWSSPGGPGELHPEVLAQPDERALTIGHSVFSSLAILQGDAAGGDTFSGLHSIAKVPPAVHPTP
jgi:hypothetical protein